LAWLFPEPLQRHEVATTWPERKYSEKLEKIRVVWRIFIQWFIFFWTINIAILQLEMPRLSSTGSVDLIDRFIAIMFLCLNLFGIGVCYVVQRSCRDANLVAREISVGMDGAKDYPFDTRVLNYSTLACGLSLVLN
jgi:hypothetical protein